MRISECTNRLLASNAEDSPIQRAILAVLGIPIMNTDNETLCPLGVSKKGQARVHVLTKNGSKIASLATFRSSQYASILRVRPEHLFEQIAHQRN